MTLAEFVSISILSVIRGSIAGGVFAFPGKVSGGAEATPFCNLFERQICGDK